MQANPLAPGEQPVHPISGPFADKVFSESSRNRRQIASPENPQAFSPLAVRNADMDGRHKAALVPGLAKPLA